MASYIYPRRRNSMEEPPNIAYSFKCLEKELIELVKNDYPQIQQCMDRLCHIRETYEENYKRALEGSKHGKNSGIAGGVMMGLGLLFAPVTLGASAVLGAAGAAVATGGVAGSRSWKSKISNMQATFRQDFAAELNTFQNKLFPMTSKMKDIDQRIKEILRDINNTNHEVSYLSKYFASAYELSRFIRIYDVCGLAAKISASVNLTGEITGILVQVRSTYECSDMRNKMNQLQIIMNDIRIMLN